MSILSECAELFRNTERTHRQDFEKGREADPDWPLWFAGQLQTPLNHLLGSSLTRSEIVYCLTDVELDRQARDTDSDWADYFAEHFVERHATVAETSETLALYHMEDCPYCVSVLAAVARLGLNIELRDIAEDPDHRDALIKARQRATVPVLWVRSTDGTERWIPNSRDIIRVLESASA